MAIQLQVEVKFAFLRDECHPGDGLYLIQWERLDNGTAGSKGPHSALAVVGNGDNIRIGDLQCQLAIGQILLSIPSQGEINDDWSHLASRPQ